MKNTDPKTVDYIAKGPDFARPVLHHLRLLSHKCVPDVSEPTKWKIAHFEFKGKILFCMAAFAVLDSIREQCIKTAVEWISAGRPRYWKYKGGKK